MQATRTTENVSATRRRRCSFCVVFAISHPSTAGWSAEGGEMWLLLLHLPALQQQQRYYLWCAAHALMNLFRSSDSPCTFFVFCLSLLLCKLPCCFQFNYSREKRRRDETAQKIHGNGSSKNSVSKWHSMAATRCPATFRNCPGRSGRSRVSVRYRIAMFKSLLPMVSASCIACVERF